ncbi:MAG: hypothetical protein LUG88_06780 [Clostridia bacterium]|nr:hypothetical protein [Clostridia bacterium]
MLYKKNCSEKLDDGLFENPTSEYRGTPFWSWNCELDRDELLYQIDCLREMGFGGYHIHSRTGMATPYLTDEFLDLVSACEKRGGELGMLTWLYDEDRWPSGSAGGSVTSAHPEYRQRLVTLETEIPDTLTDDRELAVKNAEPYLLAAYDIFKNERGELTSYKRTSRGNETPDGAERIYFVCYPSGPSPWFNNSCYIDTLNPDAAREFIRVTHETYKARLGDKFGKTIPAIFTDEPQFATKRTLETSSRGRASLPWTPKFPEVFRERFGYDILERLPEVIYEIEGGVSAARYHYHDNTAEMFASGFLDVVGEWCGRNGISLTGHLMEEPTLESQTPSVGDAMRGYRTRPLRGSDMLCNRVELTTAKQTQSAVHQYGREGMTSELYGVTNWDFDFRGHKFQGDWQAALGVTVRVPHLSWVSMKGDAKRDYPASINYQSPWYSHYSYVENHFARVNTAMTRGTPEVNVAVIHPVESYWLHFGPNDSTSNERRRLEENFANITRWLLTGTIDFDFICESTLPAQYEKTDDAKFTVGKMKYGAVVVPECETIRKTTLEMLDDFASRGGRVIFMGEPPRYVDAKASEDGKSLYEKCVRVSFSRTAVLTALEDFRTVKIRRSNGTDTENLIYQKRHDMTCDWLFAAHISEPSCPDVSHPEWVSVTLSGEYVPTLYDTLTGEMKEIPFEVSDGKTVIHTTLFASDSLLLRLDPCVGKAASKSAAPSQREGRVVFSADFKSPVEYSLSEPNVLLLDTAEFSCDGGEWSRGVEEIIRADNICRERLGMGRKITRPAQPWTVKKETPTHKISFRFTFESEIEYSGALLAIECAKDAEITFNGERVSSAPVGFFTDHSIETVRLPDIKVGCNVLETTLPLGERTSSEWCYILGNFGVRLEGCKKTIVSRRERLGFGSVTNADMPFYSGNVTYKIPVATPAGEMTLRLGAYRGAAVLVSLDGGEEKIAAYEPYTVSFGEVGEGVHEISLTLLGTRHNSFGALHATDFGNNWYGADKWYTRGEYFSYEYHLRDMGIMTSPTVTVSCFSEQ